MGKSGPDAGSARARSLHQMSMFLCGTLLSMPSVVIDLLLSRWEWTPREFGWGILLQGLGALVGTRLVARRQHGASLTLASGILGAAGTVLVYVAGQPWLGLPLCGLAIGVFTTLANSSASLDSEGPRLLSLLNMTFTAGAVACPLLLATALSIEDSGLVPAETWTLLPGICALSLALLGAGLALTVAKQKETPRMVHLERRAPQMSKAELCAGVVLFCYVGTEINLSNGWLMFLHREAQLAEQLARCAGPAFWAGLFAARILSGTRHPAPARLVPWLRIMGAASTVVIFAALAGSATLSGRGLPQGFGLGDFPEAWGRPLMLLALGSASGASIGAAYAFVLGALASQQGFDKDAPHLIARTMQWGVAGAIIMPALAGMVAAQWGFRAHMVFVLATQIVFLLGALIWPRKGPNDRTGNKVPEVT